MYGDGSLESVMHPGLTLDECKAQIPAVEKSVEEVNQYLFPIQIQSAFCLELKNDIPETDNCLQDAGC